MSWSGNVVVDETLERAITLDWLVGWVDWFAFVKGQNETDGWQETQPLFYTKSKRFLSKKDLIVRREVFTKCEENVSWPWRSLTLIMHGWENGCTSFLRESSASSLSLVEGRGIPPPSCSFRFLSVSDPDRRNREEERTSLREMSRLSRMIISYSSWSLRIPSLI